jgi:hypothetical protein
LAANSKSKAAFVSVLFRCLRSDTQSVTVETISRAAARGLATFFFRTDLLATASARFSTFIFDLFIITVFQFKIGP